MIDDGDFDFNFDEMVSHYERLDGIQNKLIPIMDELEPMYRDPHANAMYEGIYNALREIVEQKIDLIRSGLFDLSLQTNFEVLEDGHYKIVFPDAVSGLSIRRLLHPKTRHDGILETKSRAAVRNLIYSTVQTAIDRAMESGQRFEPLTHCKIDFLFYFPQDRVQDVDNYLIIYVINGLKNNGVIVADHYKYMRYAIHGSVDENHPRLEVNIKKTDAIERKSYN